jgi:uncharacterized protein (TIGR00730 family)
MSERLRLCVFCGSRTGTDPAFVAAARSLGRALAERDVELVYGGGRAGMMGAVAEACLDAGGHVIGVFPRARFVPEELHRQLPEIVETEGMHERKMEMTRRADAFAVLPGGYGTLDEMFEAITWRQIRIHDKPIGLLEVNGFFAPLTSFIDHLLTSGFIDDDSPRPLVEDDAGRLIERLLPGTG